MVRFCLGWEWISLPRTFGQECLLARRLVERGVRFIELTCPRVGEDRWDQHGNLKSGHDNNARAVDQPISALLTDLKTRGMLDETLVLWAGEFGRTPFAQGTNGRDHNQFGFPVWLAGGGIKGGRYTGRRTNTDIMPWRTRWRCSICTRPFCTCWASITRN